MNTCDENNPPVGYPTMTPVDEYPIGTRVRLRDPAQYAAIGVAVGVVRSRLKASGRLRVEFAGITHHGRATMSSFRDEQVERVDDE